MFLLKMVEVGRPLKTNNFRLFFFNVDEPLQHSLGVFGTFCFSSSALKIVWCSIFRLIPVFYPRPIKEWLILSHDE